MRSSCEPMQGQVSTLPHKTKPQGREKIQCITYLTLENVIKSSLEKISILKAHM